MSDNSANRKSEMLALQRNLDSSQKDASETLGMFFTESPGQMVLIIGAYRGDPAQSKVVQQLFAACSNQGMRIQDMSTLSSIPDKLRAEGLVIGDINDKEFHEIRSHMNGGCRAVLPLSGERPNDNILQLAFPDAALVGSVDSFVEEVAVAAV